MGLAQQAPVAAVPVAVAVDDDDVVAIFVPRSLRNFASAFAQ